MSTRITVSITAPSAGSTVSGTSSIKATAKSVTWIRSVKFYVDGTLKATDTRTPYAYPFDSTKYSNGNHSLSVVATAAGGGYSATDAVSTSFFNLKSRPTKPPVTPPVTPPVVDPTQPTGESTGSTGTPVTPTPPVTDPTPPTGTSTAPYGNIPGSWQQTWGDEFNGTSLDSSKWCSSWFNGGSMNNVSTSASNVSETDGSLVLNQSSSGVGSLVDSNPKDCGTAGYQFTTGYLAEARVYFPGSGSRINNWPAFWTDGQSWPANGEIDIAEGLGTLTSNYHSPSGANNSNTIPGTWSNGYHVYAVDRENGVNYIYWDGNLVRSYASNDGGAPQYLIFNVGNSGGATTGADSQVKVDWVRVWKKS